jgi:hypothetical protein
MDSQTTLKQIKDFLHAHIDEGCKCPACGQEVKKYRRALNAQMAWFLIALFRAPKRDGWVDIRTLDVRGGDYAKTLYWGLVELRGNIDPTRRTSGLWRLTQKGLLFVHDQVRVPRHALVYNGRCLGFSNQDIGIRQALGQKFDYQRLMCGDL